MRKIIDYFHCACIFHNWLIDDPIPPQWMDLPLEEDDDLNDQVVPNEDNNCVRRTQLYGYILEKFNCY